MASKKTQVLLLSLDYEELDEIIFILQEASNALKRSENR